MPLEGKSIEEESTAEGGAGLTQLQKSAAIWRCGLRDGPVYDLGDQLAHLGDAIRRLALPLCFFITGGTGSTLKTRLFWMIGPQSIGTFVGVLIGIALVLY